VSALGKYVLSLILAAFPPGKHPEVETRDAGAARLEVVALAEADSAELFSDRWPEGATDLARAGTSAFGWSMGFRRDVQVGTKRGPAGEACFADMQPLTLRTFAQFETAGLTNEQMAALVVGLDYASLRRCFDAGFAGLVHARVVAERRCKSDVVRGTFALYASGRWCQTPAFSSQGSRVFPAGWIEGARVQTLQKFRARKETVFPSWYVVPAEASS